MFKLRLSKFMYQRVKASCNVKEFKRYCFSRHYGFLFESLKVFSVTTLILGLKRIK